MKCNNCRGEIVDSTPYGYNRHWVHKRNDDRKCEAPNIAVPEKED